MKKLLEKYENSFNKENELIKNIDSEIYFIHKFKKSKLFSKKIEKIINDSENNKYKYWSFIESLNTVVANVIMSFILLIIISYIPKINNGTFELGDIILMLNLMIFLTQPLLTIGNQMQLLKSNKNIINFFKNLESNTVESKERIKNIKLNDYTLKFEKILLNKIHYEFKNNIYVLKGSNGSGKTTLMKDIVFNPKISNILINNIEKKINYERMLYVSNEFKFCDDIFNNDIFINKNYSDLSNGEKQIEIFKLIIKHINDFDFIVFDESFSYIDIKTRKKIYDYISKIKNKIIIVIKHDDIILLNAIELEINEGVLYENINH